MKTLMIQFRIAPRAPLVRVVATLLVLYSSLPAVAQQPAPAAATPRPQYERVVVTSGRSTVVATDFDVTRIAITNPEIADAVVVQPREILVDGKKSGTVSLIVWGADTRRQYDIVVEPAITVLEQQLQALFPGEAIAVSVSEEAIVLSGHGVEHRRHAPRRRDRRLVVGEEQGDQHAPGSRRQREPAGHAAGAVCGSESQGAHRARNQPVRQSRAVCSEIHDPAVRSADLRR